MSDDRFALPAGWKRIPRSWAIVTRSTQNTVLFSFYRYVGDRPDGVFGHGWQIL